MQAHTLYILFKAREFTMGEDGDCCLHPATEAPNGRILALTPEPTRRQKFGRKAPHRTIISHTIFCATSISFVVAGALLLVAHPPFNLYGFVIRII